MPLLMAACTVPSILILRKPNPLSRENNPRRYPICLRGENSATIAFSSSSFRNGRQPETECPVPLDQQPVNEYTALSTSFSFSWAAADLGDYCTRLALVGSSFAILVGLPVAAFGTGAVADSSADALRCCLAAASAGILSVILAVLRMYLGWAYVGNRLLSATVECINLERTKYSRIQAAANSSSHCGASGHTERGNSAVVCSLYVKTAFIFCIVDEETGWYDGQIWVKTPEVLIRDRLLGSFSVKPVLSRLKFTLVGLAISLAVCVIIFIDVENPREIPDKAGEKVIAGVYNDEAARFFEPDAFCGEPDL